MHYSVYLRANIMDFEYLKKGIKEIVDVVSGVPEKFQDRCFDVLLASLLAEVEVEPDSSPKVSDTSTKGITSINDKSVVGSEKIPLNAALNVFMRKRKVSLEQLGELLYVETNAEGKIKVHFIHTPDHTTPNATAQIYWSLLYGLKANIESGGDFLVDPEGVREVCKDEGCYDAGNFAKNFKRYETYFKAVPKPNGPPQSLSDEGQSALADFILRLVGQSK